MTITFTSGSRESERISFDLKNAVLIGRSHSAQIRLRELDVSGRHAEITKSDSGVFITCYGRHGLRVNGFEVSMDESRPLSVGDEITIGRQVRFIVEDAFDDVDETAIIVASQPKALSENTCDETRTGSTGSNYEISRLLDNVPKLDDLMAEDGPEEVSLSLNSLLSKYPDNIYAKIYMVRTAYCLGARKISSGYLMRLTHL
ncbi:MAG: FHA domain-containing protein [Kiritimatiellae bacterium]|nr:FHA domain-containing protein [Kiritimatiellia bacterium]